MAELTKPAAPQPAANLPNYNDPETARLVHYWETTYGQGPEGPVRLFKTCPTCKYALMTRNVKGKPAEMCSWDPRHSNVNPADVE